MNKAARKRQFPDKERKIIYNRDLGCLFCRENYHMEKATSYELGIFEVMHIVPRSQGGLGIAKNGIIGCKYHHMMYDNGKEGYREEMLQRIERYMKTLYRDWNTDELKYNKWSWAKR